ncbi:MAG: exodeoxyribonuclease VII large subunit [Pseudomonadota bacterium]
MTASQRKDIWSVSALNRAARELLEQGLGVVWIEAEVSNLARPASGHVYFSLKDGGAQLRAAFFRQRQRGSVGDLTNGDKVLVRGKLSLYEPRGDYQLIVDRLEPAGEGALRRAFEILKLKLAAEGLFNESGKQQLPAMPSQIGIVTSASGAALRDILQVLNRRMPGIPIIIYASSVQGANAPHELRAALALAVSRDECDVLILARGGGSLEDLQAFNDEALARAIAACPLPVVCGVGHETDFTICDFVADLRAPTPSAAAELATPDQRDIRYRLARQSTALLGLVRRALQRHGQHTDQLARRLALQSPAARVTRQQRTLDGLISRLVRTTLHARRQPQQQLDSLRLRLRLRSPQQLANVRTQQLDVLRIRLVRAERGARERSQFRLQSLVRELHAISPLATLARGYAIVSSNSGRLVSSIHEVANNAPVQVQLQDGQFAASVTGKTPDAAADKT